MQIFFFVFFFKDKNTTYAFLYQCQKNELNFKLWSDMSFFPALIQNNNDDASGQMRYYTLGLYSLGNSQNSAFSFLCQVGERGEEGEYVVEHLLVYICSIVPLLLVPKHCKVYSRHWLYVGRRENIKKCNHSFFISFFLFQ